ncbi:MAG: hypothetical protein JNN04_10165 [Cyclobacteriaceae bacterium]|nr:hypothetical protein [Cyclobacteriaceae bacterium]
MTRFGKYQYLILLVICCLFWLAYVWLAGTIHSGYHFMDDHLIVSINTRLQSSGFLGVCDYYINVYEPVPRFRPMFWIMKVLEGEILGVNMYVHYAYLALLAGFTSFFLYLFARKLSFSSAESALFVLLVLVGPQIEIWYMTGAAENRGMFFLSLALYASTYISTDKGDSFLRKLLFFTLVVITSLCKESFILFIPSFIVIVILLPCLLRKTSILQSIRENQVLTILLLLVMAAELLYVKNRGTDFAYAGVDAGQSVFAYAGTLATYVANNWGFLLVLSPILSFAAILAVKREIVATEGLIDRYLFLLVFVPVVVVPQIFLYTKSGLDGRYCVPLSLGVAFFLMLPLSFARYALNELFLPYRIALVLLLASPAIGLLAKRYQDSNNLVRYFLVRNYENKIIASIEEHAISDPKKPIVVVMDPAEIPTLENQYALDVYIRELLKKKNPVFFYLISKSSPSSLSGLQKQFYEMAETQSKGRTLDNISDKSEICSVVIFSNLEDLFLDKSKDWFVPGLYKRVQGDEFIHYHE